MHRKIPIGLSLLFLLTVFALIYPTRIAETLAPFSITSVQTTPNATAKQGAIILVDVVTKGSLPKGCFAQLGSNKSALYWLFEGKEQQIHYQAIFGIGVDDTTKATPLKLFQANGQLLKDSGTLTITKRDFGKQNLSVSKSKSKLEPITGELEAIGALKNRKSGTRYWQLGEFINPTGDCQNSPFGVRRYYNGKYSGNYHKGVDLRSPMSRPVKATSGGIVEIATTKFRLHGGTIGIDHGQGVSSIYIHLSKVLVKPGQVVKAGAVIGQVGSTGFAMGPHLHWGLYANGNPVDPNQWVPFKKCG